MRRLRFSLYALVRLGSQNILQNTGTISNLRWLTAHALTPILQGLPKSLYLLAGVGPLIDWLHFLQRTFKFDCSEPAMLPEYVRAVWLYVNFYLTHPFRTLSLDDVPCREWVELNSVADGRRVLSILAASLYIAFRTRCRNLAVQSDCRTRNYNTLTSVENL